MRRWLMVLLLVGCGQQVRDVERTSPPRPQPPRVEEPTALDLAARADEIRAEFGVAPPSAHDLEVAAEVSKASRMRQRRERSLRRWAWESPSETRARLWNVPEHESAEATATALLRICISEADGSEADCVGIWQVLNNIRSRRCNRERVQLITECDANGETLLSAMRRAQRYATGAVAPRHRRVRWVAQLDLTCSRPAAFPGDEAQWRRQYGRPCARTSELAQRLVAGREVEPAIRGARAITWGGRCEDPRGACDDPLACARGLARIRGTGTLNAFWCRPGTPGCAADVDPICARHRQPARPPSEGAARRPGGSSVPGVDAYGGGRVDGLAGEPAQSSPVGDEGEPVS